MGLIALPRQLATKPRAAQINWSHPLARGLEAFWLMNEGGGLIVRDIVHGRYNGTIGDGSTMPWSPARAGVGLRSTVTGSTNRLTIPTLTSGATWSLEMWIRPDSLTDNYGTIIATASASSGLWLRSTGKLDFYMSGDKQSTAGLAVGKWYHVAVVCPNNSGTNFSFFINGVLDSSPSSLGSSSDFTSIGNDVGSDTFHGCFDFIRFWKGRALTASEVQRLYVDPYGMLVPASQFRWAIPAAPAASGNPRFGDSNFMGF